MLTREENELLARVGPGTPMGNVLRSYWLPVLLTSEIAKPDGQPVRVRILGEDLVAFRATDGQVGLLGAHCPHRRTELFFGRNEENGLRCIYHGWKFDVAGHCVELPNEPPESNFANKIQQLAYPCMELGGVVWAYLGKAPSPPSPGLEIAHVPAEHQYMTKRYQEANWVQGLEGDVDSSHLAFLHSSLGKLTDGSTRALTSSFNSVVQDRQPRFETLDTESGLLIAARRNRDAEHYHWRVTVFIAPCFVIIPPYGDSATRINAWVPMDDESTMVWLMDYHGRRPITAKERMERDSGVYGHIAPGDLLPPTTQPGGNWRSRANMDNDFLRDYEMQRTQNFTGLRGFGRQDQAAAVSLGPIADRWNEHLGASDIGVIRVRRFLLAAARALEKTGTLPPGRDPGTQELRAVDIDLPRDKPWVEATRDLIGLGETRPARRS